MKLVLYYFRCTIELSIPIRYRTTLPRYHAHHDSFNHVPCNIPSMPPHDIHASTGKSQCPYPGDPPNGLIAPLKFNYDAGDYLSVQCRPGFIQIQTNGDHTTGPPERPKCQPDGKWSGPLPKCRSYEEV